MLKASPFGIEDIKYTPQNKEGKAPMTASFIGNTFTSNTPATGYGLYLLALETSSQTVTGTGNNITGWRRGVTTDKDDEATLTTTFNYNNIAGNRYGWWDITGVMQNAENNWWGASSGPYHHLTNPFGQGDTVSDNVDFTPWLTTEYGDKTIMATAYGPGTITPSGAIIVSYGSDTTFIFNPNTGSHMDSLVVDGINHGDDSTYYKFTNVISDHTITAYFSINTYPITASVVGNGTVNPMGVTYVPHGGSQPYTIVPAENHHIDSVIVDGENQGPIANYTFTNVTGPHTIVGYFSAIVPGWTQKVSILTGVPGKYVKDGGALVAAGGNLYAFRGNKSNEFYKYPVADTWSRIESIPFGRKWPDTTRWNNKRIAKGAALCYDETNTIYATRGNGTYEFWAYHIPTRQWTQKAFVPSTKALKGGTSLAYLGGYVYLLAGGQKQAIHNFFFRYNVSTERWETLPKPDIGTKDWKDGSAICAYDSKIYAMKGSDKPNYFRRFDPANLLWAPHETLTTFDSVWGGTSWQVKKLYVKDGSALVATDNAIYAIKGGGVTTFYKYTPTTGWRQLVRDTIPRLHKKSVPKTGAALAYANNAVWLLKGNNTLEFWKYIPPPTLPLSTITPSTITSVMTEKTPTTGTFTFDVNPNPLTNFATIRYIVPVSSKVSLKLYNASGRLIEILIEDYLNAGSYSTKLSTKHLTKGIYFLKYEDMNNTKEIKLIVQ